MLNKKNISKKIPAAIVAIQNGLLKPGTDIVPKEYDGYTASLGAAIITSGFLPAITFYTDAGRKKDRHKILQAIHKINGYPQSTEKDNLFLHIQSEISQNQLVERQLKNEVLEAAIALKLAFRNFRQEDKKYDND